MNVWEALSAPQRSALVLRAAQDPVFFAENEYFLGHSLYPKQAEVLREFYCSGHPYTHLVMAVGMRSGKTFLSSIFMSYEVFLLLILPGVPATHFGLARNSKIFAMNIAKAETQAIDTVWSPFVDNVRESPFFQTHSKKILTNEIRFSKKKIVCRALPSTSASQVGKTCKIIVFDELAKLDETESSKSAHEVYTTLSKSTADFQEARRIIVIGSIMHAGDEIMRLYELAQDRKKFPWILAYKIPTWEFNPRMHFDPETGKGSPSLMEAYAESPDMFWRDYGCEPSAASRSWVRDLEPWNRCMYAQPRTNAIEEYALMSRLELEHYVEHPPDLDTRYPGYMYVLAGDPALRRDAFGIALTHFEDDMYVCDGLWRFKPTKVVEVDALHLRAFLLTLCAVFPIQYAVFDTWAFAETQQEIRERGIPVLDNTVQRCHYERVAELISDTKLRLPTYPYLIEEIKRLKIISEKKVNHSQHSSKDVADALCNTIWAIDEVLETSGYTSLVGTSF